MRELFQTHCDLMWIFLTKQNRYVTVALHYVFNRAKYISYAAFMSQCVGYYSLLITIMKSIC